MHCLLYTHGTLMGLPSPLKIEKGGMPPFLPCTGAALSSYCSYPLTAIDGIPPLAYLLLCTCVQLLVPFFSNQVFNALATHLTSLYLLQWPPCVCVCLCVGLRVTRHYPLSATATGRLPCMCARQEASKQLTSCCCNYLRVTQVVWQKGTKEGRQGFGLE
jgi:hypothetical protein